MKRKKLFIKAVLVCLTAAVLILLGTGSAGANTITADQMISSVTSWEGKTGYEGWCLLWVQDAWRKTGVSDGLYYGANDYSSVLPYDTMDDSSAGCGKKRRARGPFDAFWLFSTS